MKFTTRELVTLTVFGTLWGAVEISVGSLLHLLNLPLSGPLLAAVGLTIALIGRLFVPRRGSIFYTGVVATVLKLFSVGSVVVGPMIGIMMEAILAEMVLTLLGQPRRLSFILAGGLGVLWTMAQPFFTGVLLFGREIFVIWLDLLDSGSRILGLDPEAAVWILTALGMVHFVLGALSGWLAWGSGRLLRARLGGNLLLPSSS